MKCKIAHAQDSHIGLKRENNEDSFICLEFSDIPELIALGAIDGVGGYTGGEVAAKLCKYFVEKYLEKHQSELHKNPLEFISHALQKANNVIYKEREKQEHLSRMSCVATVALLNCKQECLYFAHVGDTRGYIYRKSELIKFTEDHSLVGYLQDLGEITEEEALAHPRRNEVSKALGGKVLKPGSKYIQSGEHSFYSNDIVLFCSDGLTDLVTRDEIRVILQSEATLDEKKKALIDTANTKGGKDNITVALASYPKKTKEVTNVIISKTKRQSVKCTILKTIKIMNENTFQLKRFWEIVQQTLNSKKMTIGIMLLVVVLLPLLLLLKDKYLIDHSYDGVRIFKQARFYRNVFAAFTILAPFLFFFNVNRSKNEIVQPMLHATALEKFLNMALFCFALVPLSVAIVYGVSHSFFSTIFPQYLVQLKLMNLQYQFIGKLFTPTLIFLMQTTFFFNLLFRERKVRKLFLTLGVIVFIELLFPYISFQINRYVPAFILLLLRVFGSLYVPLISILSAFLFISSCFLLKRKSIPLTTNLPAARCDKCGAKLKEI